jgi:hypothetical protein
MKIRLRYIGLPLASLAAACVLAVVFLWTGFPFGAFPGRHRPPVPVQVKEPVLRAHEVLVRMDRNYAARMDSMLELRRARMAQSQYASAEDEVLSGAERLLSVSRTPADAAKSSREKLADLSAQAGPVFGRVGLDMGPAMTPQLVRARVKDPIAQRQIGGRVYELQFAACVDAILAYVAAKSPETNPPQETAK